MQFRVENLGHPCGLGLLRLYRRNWGGGTHKQPAPSRGTNKTFRIRRCSLLQAETCHVKADECPYIELQRVAASPISPKRVNFTHDQRKQ